MKEYLLRRSFNLKRIKSLDNNHYFFQVFPLPKSQYQFITLTMTLQELVDYYDTHPEQQEEIRANVWEWWFH